MDSNAVEMAEGGPAGSPVIAEKADMIEGAVGSVSSVTVSRLSGESALEDAGEHTGEYGCKEDPAMEGTLERTGTEVGAADVKEKQMGVNGDDGQSRGETGEPACESTQVCERGEETGQTADTKDPQKETDSLEPQLEGTSEDTKKAHRLTPDFPESLYELLCNLQEGRRLNDQRCSFRLQSGVRRRCHSEPNTSKPANRVTFSSMTSLQREELFELVATAQARRLDDQRALLQRSPPKSKSRSFRGSIKQLSFVRRPEKPLPAPVPVPKEELYNMILTTQAQGRLEDQRSRAPGPMDDEDFFSLLLRVQGGRMDEQRTELPCLLLT